MADSRASGFGHFKPYGSVDIEMYLNRFTSYLFTRDVFEPEPLGGEPKSEELAAHARQVAVYWTKRKR